MKKLQAGFTLIELLVTMAVSLVILAGVVNVSQSSMISNRALENAAAMQDSARFAVDMMSRDIRMAGFTGCTAHDPENNGEDSTRAVYNKAGSFNDQILKGIQGWNANNSPNAGMVDNSTARASTNAGPWTSSDGNIFADSYAQALVSSDLLRLWTVGDGVDLVRTDVDAGIAPITNTGPGSIELLTAMSTGAFANGDVVVFGNCDFRTIAQLCNVTTDVNNTTLTIEDGGSEGCENVVGDEFNTSHVGAGVYRFAGISYFVGKRDDHEKTQPSLYRAEDEVVRELVEGVESMQILYGIDTDNSGNIRSANAYVRADQVEDRWNEVLSVRITLLMRSFETNVVPKDTTYEFNGEQGVSTDGRLRQVYSTTITLRNRISGV